jgi:hypothetical protein
VERLRSYLHFCRDPGRRQSAAIAELDQLRVIFALLLMVRGRLFHGAMRLRYGGDFGVCSSRDEGAALR